MFVSTKDPEANLLREEGICRYDPGYLSPSKIYQHKVLVASSSSPPRTLRPSVESVRLRLFDLSP